MKKTILMLITAMLCILLSACGCKHEWNEATCLAPMTCALCGKTEGEIGNHNWTEATCISPKTCTVCNETEGEALGHKWEEATASAPKTCKVCGKTEGTPLPTSYFSISREDFMDLFCNSVAKEFNLGEKGWNSYPLYYKDKFLTLFINQYPHSDDASSKWNTFEVIVNDPSSIEYNSNIAEYAINIGTKCAQILDPTFDDNDIHSAFLLGADTAKKEWSENYNRLQFWYSKNGFEYYINDHVNEVGTWGNYKPVSYWYRFTISLSANK